MKHNNIRIKGYQKENREQGLENLFEEKMAETSLNFFFNCLVCLRGVDMCDLFIYFGDQTLV